MHEKGSENRRGSSLLPDPARRPAHYTESAGELAGPARSLNQVGGQGNREKVRLRTAGRA